MTTLTKTLSQTFPTRMLRRMGRAVNSLSSQKNSASSSSVLDSMYAAQVTRIRRETSRAVTVEFELLDGYRLNYKAGQFVTVCFPVGATYFQRCYSFSSAPHENRYAITVQKVFRGRVSGYVQHDLKVGDRIYIDEPEGEFVLPDRHPEDQRYVMIAAGAGVVPIYSLVKDLLGKNPVADIQLVYASRNKEQAIFGRELDRLQRVHEGFSLWSQYTRNERDGHDPFKRLDGERILTRLADPASAHMYICGPYGLVRKCTEGFQKVGIPKSKINIETFNSPPASSIAKALKPRSLTFLPSSFLQKPFRTRQQRVEPLLESARSAGASIPQRCTVGNCQTCKVKVKSGTVLMDEPNNLSIEEAQAGYVLSCVSYPCEPVVVKIPGN